MNKRDKAIRRNAMNVLKAGLAKNIDKARPKNKTLERVLTKSGIRNIGSIISHSAGADRFAVSRHTGFSDYRPTNSVPARIETRKGKRKIVRKRKNRWDSQKDEYGRSLKDQPVTKGYWDMSPRAREVFKLQEARDMYYLEHGHKPPRGWIPGQKPQRSPRKGSIIKGREGY